MDPCRADCFTGSAMRSVLAILAALATTALAGGGWETDWEAARERAAREDKLILMNLTGSDWCSWCMKLKEKVFARKEFLDFAERHLVLMEVDFPQRNRLPEETVAQNKRLRKIYLNRGYPTVWLLDARGNKLSEDLGEFSDDPAEWLTLLRERVSRPRNGS